MDRNSCFVTVRLPLPTSTFRRSYTSITPKRLRQPRDKETETESKSIKRSTIRASSLEDSKRRARSNYDNIPDINEQYLAELAWIERKYGPDRLGKKNPAREAQKSIIVDSSRKSATKRTTDSGTGTEEGTDEFIESDLEPYVKVRNRLFGDTIFMGALGICVTWSVSNFKDVTSFSLGVGLSLAYVTLLSRSVDRMADAAKAQGVSLGDVLQPARVGLLAIAVVGAAKNTDRFSVVAVILGFLTYKLATLLPLLTGEAFED